MRVLSSTIILSILLVAFAVSFTLAAEDVAGDTTTTSQATSVAIEPEKTLIQTLSQRLRNYNRNILSVASLKSKEFTDALLLFATSSASLNMPRINSVLHEFPHALPQVGSSGW